MIVSKFIQSNQLLLRHPRNFKRARICKPAMAFVTDTDIASGIEDAARDGPCAHGKTCAHVMVPFAWRCGSFARDMGPDKVWQGPLMAL